MYYKYQLEFKKQKKKKRRGDENCLQVDRAIDSEANSLVGDGRWQVCYDFAFQRFLQVIIQFNSKRKINLLIKWAFKKEIFFQLWVTLFIAYIGPVDAIWSGKFNLNWHRHQPPPPTTSARTRRPSSPGSWRFASKSNYLRGELGPRQLVGFFCCFWLGGFQ